MDHLAHLPVVGARAHRAHRLAAYPMTQQCSHQTTADIDARWADPRTKAVSVEDLTVCPCCCGPAKVGPPIEVSPEGDWEHNGTVLRAYPGFEARLIENCSRCQ